MGYRVQAHGNAFAVVFVRDGQVMHLVSLWRERADAERVAGDMTRMAALFDRQGKRDES